MNASVGDEGGRPHRPLPAQMSPVPREGRPYQGRRAGIVSRLAASTVDFAVVGLIVGAGYGALSAALFLWSPSSFRFPAVPGPVLLATSGLVLFTYLTLSWFTTGRTYGDHLFGLRVVDRHGERLRLLAAAVRAWLCLMLPVGVFWAAVSRSNRSVQDVVLRTSVIYDWTLAHVDVHPEPTRASQPYPGP